MTVPTTPGERRDPHTGREIEAPEVHAGKLSALLADLDAFTICRWCLRKGTSRTYAAG
jgi:hypothetical protein